MSGEDCKGRDLESEIADIEKRALYSRIARIQATFSYHQPSEDQVRRIHNVREVCKHAVEVLLLNIPEGHFADVVVDRVREAMMHANAAIVNERPRS